MNRVSLLFPAYNRLEFTKQAWAALMANTDWSLVAEFHVYDDGSTDGTREWLERQVREWLGKQPCVRYWYETSFRSPMGVTLDWIRRSSAPILAKLDNDTIYPPHWFNVALDVMDRHPELDCLGLECMRTPAHWAAKRQRYIVEREDGAHTPFGYLPAIYVSGLGLYRRSAFRDKLPHDGGYFGFEEFMQANCKSGWILPSLPTILLDRLPMEPWKSLSEEYVRRGWQRPWSGAGPLRYKPEQHAMWSWWKPV